MRSVVNTAKILLTYFIYKNRGATEETGVTTFFGIRLSVNIFIIIIARQRKHKIKIKTSFETISPSPRHEFFIVFTKALVTTIFSLARKKLSLDCQAKDELAS